VVVYEIILKQKAPKVIVDMLAWMNSSLRQYGSEGINSKDMISVVKFGLGNSNQTVRNQAVALCGSMRLFFGPAIRAPLQDLNAALLTLIDTEFEKVMSEPAPQIKKRGLDQASRSSSATVVDANVSTKKVEDNVVRDDISSLVTDDMIQKMNDSAWKVRKESLDELADVLKRSKHIQSNLPHDLFTSLKARLNDSNKMIVIQSLDIISTLSSAIGSAFDRPSKVLLSSVLLCLNDQKAQVRTAAVGAIQSISDSTGFENGLSFYGQALVPDMSNLRKELTKWIGENDICLEVLSSKSVDVSSMIHPFLLCLLDKNAEVRKYSQICLKSIICNVGVKGIKSQISDHFKGIQLKTLTEALEPLSCQPVSLTKPEPVAKSKAEPSTEKKTERPVSKKSEPKESKEEKKPKSIPLSMADARLKAQRADKNSGIYRWAFDSPRKDLMDFLRSQSEANFSNDLHALLFSEGHFKEKDHLQGLQELESFFKGTDESNTDPELIMKLTVLSSDLILKYLTVRFYDTNTTMLLKALDVTEILLSLLEKQNYSLMEYEASSFLPHFLMKVLFDGIS
jgi:cytoskeleton-associated protein 5